MPRTKAKARAKRAEALKVEQSRRNNNQRRQAREIAALNEWQMFAEQSSTSQPFTMAAEARNIGFRGYEWQSQGQLRKMPVNFVKSDLPDNDEQDYLSSKNACVTPTKDFTATEVEEDTVSEVEIRGAEPSGHSSAFLTPRLRRKLSGEQEAQDHTSVSAAIQKLVLDTSKGDLTPTSEASNECADTDDDTQSQVSSDSDDIVLFSGRGKRPKQPPEKRPESADSTRPVASNSSQLSSPVRCKDIASLPYGTSSQTGPGELDPKPEPELKSDDIQYTPRRRDRIICREMKREAEEDAIFQDYIDNMSSGNGSDSERSAENIEKNSKLSEASWNSDDIRDLQDMSTSDEEPPSKVERILSRRNRKSGLQYLVRSVSQRIDEARWIHSGRLEHISEQVRVFEAKYLKSIAEATEAVSSKSATSETSAVIKDLLDEIDSEDEEIKAVQRRGAAMTDQHIAHALARQEMFGMPTDEVILFDDTISKNGGSDQDIHLEDEEDYVVRLHRRHSKDFTGHPSKSHQGNTFPSASAFADALDQDPYGAFDVMDFERPSLKKKSKGRRGRVDLEGLDDEELALQLQQSWENDRQKKKTRKLERQELREQGKLGQKNGRLDIRARYPRGMKHPQVKAEVKTFMLQPVQSMAFPPMQAHLRSYLHMLASKAGVTSKSQGSGTERFTILTKKKSTPFNMLSEEDVDHQLSAKKTRDKGNARRAAAVVARRKGAGGVKNGASYKDGEVVGAAAPEIGTGNRGRAMLEKMGWTSGTALGAFDNKGIIDPVVHVVKNSKSGLG